MSASRYSDALNVRYAACHDYAQTRLCEWSSDVEKSVFITQRTDIHLIFALVESGVHKSLYICDARLYHSLTVTSAYYDRSTVNRYVVLILYVQGDVLLSHSLKTES